MNKKTVFKLDKQAYKYGINLSLSVQFFEREDGETMELLSCVLSDGVKAIDYEFVIDKTTLLDIIKEFI